uniref:Uncharacterized protein n=1 Tax=Sphenodon punctatus TaxID=8508 RepID=A0A8D0HK76_SPHPU
MPDLEQPGLLLPDRLIQMEALEDAPDPFFGVMEPALPSPTSIPQIRRILESPTPEKRRPPPRPPLPPRRKRPGMPPLTVVSPEIITLKEPEPIRLLLIEGERDLPEITVREIDMLAEQEGFVMPTEEGPPKSPPALPPKKRRRTAEPIEEPRVREAAEMSPKLSPPTRVGEEPPTTVTEVPLDEEVTHVVGEEAPLPLEVTPPRDVKLPPPHSPAVTPELERRPLPSPKLQLPLYEPPPPRPRRRRRRQLRFLDADIQISREEFQKQIQDAKTQCRPLVSPGVLRPSPPALTH